MQCCQGPWMRSPRKTRPCRCGNILAARSTRCFRSVRFCHAIAQSTCLWHQLSKQVQKVFPDKWAILRGRSSLTPDKSHNRTCGRIASLARWYHWFRNYEMISRKDCKCPCHRVGRGVVHVMPCCGPRGPGSGLVTPQSKRRKDKTITLFAKPKP